MFLKVAVTMCVVCISTSSDEDRANHWALEGADLSPAFCDSKIDGSPLKVCHQWQKGTPLLTRAGADLANCSPGCLGLRKL
jgi:hypothetical protein